MKFAIVAIGGSAGALQALQRVVADLPAGIPAAVFVVTHIPPDSISAMPHILSRSGPLFATHAIDGAPIAAGRIAVAPPNCHLVIQPGVMRVVNWARENGQRPSIDVLFRSAAESYGDSVCGVLLSGTLDDGVAGLQSIRTAKGVTIAQDPEDALFPDMPRNAIDADAVTLTAYVRDLGTLIAQSAERIARTASGSPAPRSSVDERQSGTPSRFTCPDCGGTLWESDETGDLRFRCRTGHAFNVNSMASAQENTLEASLWTALRIVEERIDFFGSMTERALQRGDRRSAARYRARADELNVHHRTLRDALADVVDRRRSTAS